MESLTFLIPKWLKFVPTAKADKGPLSLEGDLALESQEGGFADDAIAIDGVVLSRAIEKHFEVRRKDNRACVARARVSIEILGDEDVVP